MRNLIITILCQLLVVIVGLARINQSISNDKDFICYIPPNPYILNNDKLLQPVALPNNLKNKNFYGNIYLQVEIDTSINKIINVYVVKAMLKNRIDDKAYLEYVYVDDYAKVNSYPDKLIELYPVLKNYIQNVAIKRVKEVKVDRRILPCMIMVPIKK